MNVTQEGFKPVNFWMPRSFLSGVIRPRYWRNIFDVPMSVRILRSDWSRFPNVVLFSYAQNAHKGRICLTFSHQNIFLNCSYRWRPVAQALWKLIQQHPGRIFQEVPIDVSDCCDSIVPDETIRFSKLPHDVHDLIPNPFLLSSRKSIPQAIPWKRKTDTLYFRGALTGPIPIDHNSRVAACLESKTIPDSDCKLSQFPHTTTDVLEDLKKRNVVGDIDQTKKINHHRYQLEIDGNASSWHRYWLIGMFRCVPIRFECRWEECWHDDLMQDIHFVHASRHTLKNIIEQLRSHPLESSRIAENAAEFVRAALTKKVMQKKFENVLLQRSVKKSLSVKKLSA